MLSRCGQEGTMFRNGCHGNLSQKVVSVEWVVAFALLLVIHLSYSEDGVFCWPHIRKKAWSRYVGVHPGVFTE